MSVFRNLWYWNCIQDFIEILRFPTPLLRYSSYITCNVYCDARRRIVNKPEPQNLIIGFCFAQNAKCALCFVSAKMLSFVIIYTKLYIGVSKKLNVQSKFVFHLCLFAYYKKKPGNKRINKMCFSLQEGGGAVNYCNSRTKTIFYCHQFLLNSFYTLINKDEV